MIILVNCEYYKQPILNSITLRTIITLLSNTFIQNIINNTI